MKPMKPKPTKAIIIAYCLVLTALLIALLAGLGQLQMAFAAAPQAVRFTPTPISVPANNPVSVPVIGQGGTFKTQPGGSSSFNIPGAKILGFGMGNGWNYYEIDTMATWGVLCPLVQIYRQVDLAPGGLQHHFLNTYCVGNILHFNTVGTGNYFFIIWADPNAVVPSFVPVSSSPS
jgi:hypothetical protein